MLDRPEKQASSSADGVFAAAIIGMAGRFPGAKNIHEYWNNLSRGVESIARYTEAELMACGVDPAWLADPSFVKAGALIDGRDQFDYAFFGYTPREAELMDPQHRIFLEIAWSALEDAGYPPAHYPGQVGVFAATSLSSYLLFNLLNNADIDQVEDAFQTMIGNDKDFLATRVSYKLNLRGPSLTVQTGCSSSLVAVHLAAQHVLTYQCDLALAGGVSISVPQRTGYFYERGGITSPDGRCRPFDARGEGTIFGEGAGVVVLKRLEDAVNDRDHIYAVIRGSAINNDGSAKVGYPAPSLDGQADVIGCALSMAGVNPESLGYVEAHGTATALGDPVEVLALTRAFRNFTDAEHFCALGSVKGNIGHLDAAAGVAGLIKTALMLHHKQLAPSVHFTERNPRIQFDRSPFHVNVVTQDWRKGSEPRRAGVSSFGIGGSNAHVVLEEAPERSAEVTRDTWRVLSLSAQSEIALDEQFQLLADWISRTPACSVADLAYTLHNGRESFPYRQAVVCRDAATALALLQSPDEKFVHRAQVNNEDGRVVFLFPGGGAQYAGMVGDLYAESPVFREQIDLSRQMLEPLLHYDLQPLLLEPDDLRRELIRKPSLGLPALFAVEYALAATLRAWGVEPEAMIGHSLGEYTAACVSGVFSLQDALALVALRGRLFERLPRGGMIVVYSSEREVKKLAPGLSLAAVNAPMQCVLSGPIAEIDRFTSVLDAEEVEYRRIHIDVAAHSSLVSGIMREFEEFVSGLQLRQPSIPFISNVTGGWITASEATSPAYWTNHLRRTVRFADGLQVLLNGGSGWLVEVGPGHSLTSLVRQQIGRNSNHTPITCLDHARGSQSQFATLLTALSRLWVTGGPVAWDRHYTGERRQRIPLPTYPFERRPCWISPEPGAKATHRRRRGMKRYPISDWLYLPGWKRVADSPVVQNGDSDPSFILLEDDFGIGQAVGAELRACGKRVITVRCEARFAKSGEDQYSITPSSATDWMRLFEESGVAGAPELVIGHLARISSTAISGGEASAFEDAQERGFYSVVALAKAVAAIRLDHNTRLVVAASGIFQVSGRDLMDPNNAPLIAACKILPQESDGLQCRMIDLGYVEIMAGALRQSAEQIVAELTSMVDDPVIARRGRYRWRPSYEPLSLNQPADLSTVLRPDGVYVLTGGLGSIGLMLVSAIAGSGGRRIVLTTRSPFPPREGWHEWVAAHGERDPISRRVRRLQELERRGAQITVVQADVADQERMSALFDELELRYGAVHGVFHLAGISGDAALRLASNLEPEDCVTQFAPKIFGCYALQKALEGRRVDFCLLFSSNASILGGPGLMAYAAANSFLDAFTTAQSARSSQRWLAINWDNWTPAEGGGAGAISATIGQYAMSSAEALGVLAMMLGSDVAGQVVVSSGDLGGRIQEWVAGGNRSKVEKQSVSPAHSRPKLKSEYVEPTTALQKALASIWQEVLGVSGIGIHDHLFDLGGNSLLALRIVSKISKNLGMECSVVSLFERPTVASLSELLEQNEPSAPEFLESRARGARRRERSIPSLENPV